MGLPSSGSCRGCEGTPCQRHPTGCSDAVCPWSSFPNLPPASSYGGAGSDGWTWAPTWRPWS